MEIVIQEELEIPFYMDVIRFSLVLLTFCLEFGPPKGFLDFLVILVMLQNSLE